MFCEINRPFPLARVMAASIVGCLLLALTGCSDPFLWKSVEAVAGLPPTPQAIRSETVAIDIELLRPPSNRRIRLTLPGGIEATAVIARYEDLGEKQFIWRGTIDGEAGSEVRFSVVERTLVGAIVRADGHMYAIRSIREGIALIEELDATQFPMEEETEPAEEGTVRSRAVSLSVDSDAAVERVVTNPASGQIQMVSSVPAPIERTLVKVMVLYTSAAETYLASQDGVTASINLLISDTDNSFATSGVHQELQLAHKARTGYMDTGDPYKDLLALRHSAEIPGLGELAQMRIQYSADIVVLLTKGVSKTNSSSCGQADQLQDLDEAHCDFVFAAVPVNCATNIYSFTHEVGHVIGALHSQGFIAQSNAWFTVMASPKGDCEGPECQRIPYWSNPDIFFAEGSLPPESTGSVSANNSSRLNLSRKSIAEISDKCG